jgi:diguanylate cyclase
VNNYPKNFNTIVWFLFVVVLVASMAIVYAYGATQGRKLSNYRVEEYAEFILRASMLENYRLIEETKLLLTTWSDLASSNSSDPCNFGLMDYALGSGKYLNYGVLDINGDLVCSGLPITEPVNASDRLYFQRVLEEKDFAAGEYQIGRVTGKPAVNFGYPVFDPQGNIIQVLFIAHNLDWLNEWVQELKLPSDTEFMLTDYKGTILTKHPANGIQYGKNVDFITHFSIILAQKEGQLYFSGDDGVERLYVYGPVKDRPDGDAAAFIMVGVSKVVISEITENLLKNILIVFISALIFDAFAFYLVRKITRHNDKKQGLNT